MKYPPNLHVVLHQPEIPHNTGAVGRTCVAIAAKLWLVRPLGFQLDDRHLRRCGLDYWERLDVEVVDTWDDLRFELPGSRFWFFTKTARNSYAETQFAAGDVLVFGSETQGLPRSLIEENRDTSLRIPTRAEVRSLNLSSAVAVAGYEAMRQIGRLDDLPAPNRPSLREGREERAMSSPPPKE
jgi:tRNA (cytidine/uridine-2'-O-)-methyltransferase